MAVTLTGDSEAMIAAASAGRSSANASQFRTDVVAQINALPGWLQEQLNQQPSAQANQVRAAISKCSNR
jgi:hypothetical protein